MQLEYISSKTINFPYLIGKKAIVKIEGKYENKNSLIFFIDEKKIAISVAKSDAFKKGADCTVELLYLEKLLKFNCKIKSFDDGILYCSVPRQAEIMQQREAFRVKCDIRCDIEAFVTGKIKNISAGGVFIALDYPINKKLIETEPFKLCFNLNHNDFRITCITIEINDKFVRAKFINLDEKTKEKIENYCIAVDAEMYRRFKNER